MNCKNSIIDFCVVFSVKIGTRNGHVHENIKANQKQKVIWRLNEIIPGLNRISFTLLNHIAWLVYFDTDINILI